MDKVRTRLSSMHTHTLFCDGRDDVETMCRTAFEKGLCAIGFSAHAPIFKQTGFKSDWHLPEERLDDYIAEVTAARRRWEGKIAVYLGFELDYIKGLRCAQDGDIKAMNPDFIISSVHYIIPKNGAKPFTVDGPRDEFESGIREGFDGDGEALMHSYWDAVLEMIALGGFDIVGHVDIIKKNSRGCNYYGVESEFQRQKEIAKAAANGSLTVEINTGGLNRNTTAHTFPDLSFLRLFYDETVPVIITADAHRAADLDGFYDFALKTLREAGYADHVLFEGRKNGKAAWQRENL